MTERAMEMKGVLEEYAQSGLTRREFCERRNIPLSTFDYWRRKRAGKRKSTKPRIVEVKVSGQGPSSGFQLSLANGRRIESSWRFADDGLARLIRIAESA